MKLRSRLLTWLLAPIVNEQKFLRSTLSQGFRIMSDELKTVTAAVDALDAEVTEVVTAIKDAADRIAELTAQIAGQSPSGLETAAARIADETARLKVAADLLKPSAPAPVAAEPTPVVSEPAPVEAPAAAEAAPSA